MKDVALLLVALAVAAASVYIYIRIPEWSNDADEMSWAEALDYCTNLREHGHTDWRLPKTKELASKDISGGYWTSDSTRGKEEASDSANLRVVCVRNMPEEDPAEPAVEDLCIHARNTRTEHAWKVYLEMYPNGTCADEAKDALACENAKKQSSKEIWEEYLKKYRNGVCIDEAVKALDKISCSNSRELNTVAAMQEYLKVFPDGTCAAEFKEKIENEEKKIKEAEAEKKQEKSQPTPLHKTTKTNPVKKYKTVGGLEWYNRSSDAMTWNDAEQYCENLPEDGQNKWRLPTVDELRTLIKNCPKTESGGECKVSDKDKHLADHDFFSEKYKSNCYCEDNGNYSKLGDGSIWLWSSSRRKGYEAYWTVYFGSARVMTRSNNEKELSYVRCVR